MCKTIKENEIYKLSYDIDDEGDAPYPVYVVTLLHKPTFDKYTVSLDYNTLMSLRRDASHFATKESVLRTYMIASIRDDFRRGGFAEEPYRRAVSFIVGE